MNWIRDVRTAFEADGIGWAMWDYRGGFGVSVEGRRAGLRMVDEKVVEALGGSWSFSIGMADATKS
jgi:endoglucanase